MPIELYIVSDVGDAGAEGPKRVFFAFSVEMTAPMRMNASCLQGLPGLILYAELDDGSHLPD